MLSLSKEKVRKIQPVVLLLLLGIGVVLGSVWLRPHNSGVTAILGSLKSCTSSANQQNCWQDQVTSSLKKSGFANTLEAVAALSDSNPSFAADCHSFMHQIGGAAYDAFVSNQKFTVTGKINYCNWGFYHGFMETLVEKSGQTKQAQDFCSFIDSQLKTETPGAADACYHGIGHGAANSHDPALQGHPQEMTAAALKICELATTNPTQLRLCAGGVFMGIGDFSSHNEYGLSVNQDNPLWLCQAQPDQYKAPCYSQSYTIIIPLVNRDFSKATRYYDSLTNQEYYVEPFREVVALSFDLNDTNASLLSACRNLPNRYQSSCITGVTEGFMERTGFGSNYQRARDFCSQDFLNSAEKTDCFRTFGLLASGFYAPSKVKTICAGVETAYRSLCTHE